MGSIKRTKTKRRTRDLDQVKADLKSPKHLAQHKNTKASEDLPGLGAFYCVECSKYFSDSHNLNEHRRGKNHKRRIRMLKDEAHTQKMADAAVGLSTENRRNQHERDNEMLMDV
ncbi:hypothetical protein H2204_004562 [Knufia peltigerae]|uniref:C2H2-type domain-containing protein n=1 Tax=Knufia peltigerae TaxID=1002370 RepID=A0AA38Y745_9EURO|nr:hypothetical protein H2204_004562 [Knufia peltigerae]